MSVIVLVGATAGIGRQAAVQLAAQGHDLILAGRDETHGAQVANETGGTFVQADVSTLEGVTKLAAHVREHTRRVDVLINNAGVMTPRRSTTIEGNELNLAVHHLAPFSVTSELLPLLCKGERRVVNVNSEGHRMPLRGSGPVTIRFDDLQSERDFDPFLVYSRTKLANLLFTYELHRRHPELDVVALHPGSVRTDLARSWPKWQVRLAYLAMSGISAGSGAKPVIHLATAPDIEFGRYYDRFTPVRSSTASYDEQVARRLWAVTEELRGPFGSAR